MTKITATLILTGLLVAGCAKQEPAMKKDTTSPYGVTASSSPYEVTYSPSPVSSPTSMKGDEDVSALQKEADSLKLEDEKFE